MVRLRTCLVLAMLGGDVKRVWLNVKRLPAIDLAQRDLTAREQRPKHHAGRVRTGQHALRLDTSLELLVQPLYGVRRTDGTPLRLRIAQEREQPLAGFLEAAGNPGTAQSPFAQKGLSAGKHQSGSSSCSFFGAWAIRLRNLCTVQRCTALLGHNAARAASRPLPPSMITSSGLFRPRDCRSCSRSRQAASLSPASARSPNSTFCPSARTPRATRIDSAVLCPSKRTCTTVPSRISRTIGSPSRRRWFQLSKSACTRRQARLTVSLLTAPPKSLPSAKRTRRVFTPARYAPAISALAEPVRRL